MSDFREKRKRVGFSTGALERGNYRQALKWLRGNSVRNVELSALRFEELEPLIVDLASLRLRTFSYISFHAPSAFPADAEPRVVQLLGSVVTRGWNVIVHPDVIRKPALWRPFGRLLLLENMDRRKAVARTADELAIYFRELPQARLCLDVAHARQLDTTLTVLTEIIQRFRKQLAEVHISELDSYCAHQLMSFTSINDYRSVASHFGWWLPIIIESKLEGSSTSVRLNEFLCAEYAMGGALKNSLSTARIFYFHSHHDNGWAPSKIGKKARLKRPVKFRFQRLAHFSLQKTRRSGKRKIRRRKASLRSAR